LYLTLKRMILRTTVTVIALGRSKERRFLAARAMGGGSPRSID
jgi:hypothetical protein